jgi:hypothetical protein
MVLLPLPDGALKINNPFFIFYSSFLYLLFDRGLFGQAMESPGTGARLSKTPLEGAFEGALVEREGACLLFREHSAPAP